MTIWLRYVDEDGGEITKMNYYIAPILRKFEGLKGTLNIGPGVVAHLLPPTDEDGNAIPGLVGYLMAFDNKQVAKEWGDNRTPMMAQDLAAGKGEAE